MSSGGATLQGSFSGETGTITEVGFYYGTTSNPSTKVAATGTSTPFAKALTGLSPNTTYYYKAYVIEGGEERTGSVLSFKTKATATATVQNSAATGITSSGATLNGSYSGATGTISDRGFRYRKVGTTQWTEVGLNSGGSPFSATISGLDPETTYEFQAYVTELDAGSGTNGEYVDRWASGTLTFTTAAQGQVSTGYLTDYGMPDVSGLNPTIRQNGSNDRDDHWYSYNTNNNNRQIAVHTYTHPTSSQETVNYVVLYDGSNYAPLWTAHTMNSTQWPNNGVGRNEAWTDDPAISLTQQSGLDNASTVGYSKGHFVASEYRQSSVKQNKQTFYHSNQAPQWQNGFNGGIWNALENRVVAITPSGTTMLYVITGVLYEGTVSGGEVTSSVIPTKKSGSLNVPIPSHFYKCIMKCTFSGDTITGAQGIAFVYTNESHTGENYYDSGFVTSIDAIEARAGFDFFASVPTSYQTSAEQNKNHTWFTGVSSSNVSGVTDKSWGSF